MEHVADVGVDGALVGQAVGGAVDTRLRQILIGGVPGAVDGGNVPAQRQAQGGLRQAGQQGGKLPPGDVVVRVEGAGRVGAGEDPPAVELQNLLLIGGVVVHVPDEGPGGVAHSDGGGVQLREVGAGQGVGGDVGHLGPCGVGVVQTVEGAVKNAQGLEIEDVGGVPLAAVAAVGGGAGLRVAIVIEAAQTGGKAYRLGDGDVLLRAEGRGGLALRQAQLVEGGDIFIVPAALRHVQKTAVVGPDRDKDACAAFCGSEDRQGERQRQGQQECG